MQLLKRKLSLLPILLLVAVSISVVGAAIFFTVDISSSVTVKTTGELSVTDVDGAEVTNLDFGALVPGESGSVALVIHNDSNRGLLIVINSDLAWLWGVKNEDGSTWVQQTSLPIGASLQVSITITAPASALAGTENFVLSFVGKG